MASRQSRSLVALAAAAFMLGTTACSDSFTDPTPSQALAPRGPHLIVAPTSSYGFVLDPTVDNVFQSAEGHRLVIPAYSICNVLTSGYGAAFWNAPCSPATTPITFTITTSVNADGYSNLVVKPDVRFSPAKTVMVYFKDQRAANTEGMVIKYCSVTNGLTGCVDEGLGDPAMTTYRDPALGYIYRRLKHFSGYNVVFGFDGGDPSVAY